MVGFHEADVLCKLEKLDALIIPKSQVAFSGGLRVGTIPQFDNSPEQFGIARSQYTIDYLSMVFLDKYSMMLDTETNCLFTNGSGFALTSKFIHSWRNWTNPGPDIPIIVDCPAHSLKETIAEHVKLQGSYPYNNLTNPFLFELSTKHQQLADLIVVPSQIAKNNLLEPDNLGGKIDPNKVKVVHHGVSLPDPNRKIPERTDNRFTVLYISVFSPDKGTIYLLEAWKKMDFLFHAHSRLVLVCSNIDEEWVRQYVSRRNVFVTGRQSLEQLENWYGTADVLVNSSVTEAFGLSPLEACAHGVPVIVSKGAGVSELITDGKEGFLVEPRDVDALGDKLMFFYKITSGTKVPNGFTKYCRELAEKYTWEKQEKVLEETIKPCFE